MFQEIQIIKLILHPALLNQLGVIKKKIKCRLCIYYRSCVGWLV